MILVSMSPSAAIIVGRAFALKPRRAYNGAVLTKAISAVGRSLVFLEIDHGGGDLGFGTGYVVSRAGHVLTAEHLVRGVEEVRARPVQAGDGPRDRLQGEVLARDAEADLALLRLLGGAAHEPVALHRGPAVALGREVAFMGFPYSDIFDPPLAMAVRGIVGNRYALGKIEYLVVDAMCTEGMSGGPLFLADSGEVIGTVGSRFDPARTRAKLRGLPEAAVAGIPRERTNITFATAGKYAQELLARAGVR